MRGKRLAVGVAALGVLCGGLATPGEAVAASTPPATSWASPAQEVDLDVHGPATLITAGGRVLVADPGADRVLVLDRNGGMVGSVGDQDDPVSMTPSPDGSKVYVALRGAAAISEIDVATVAETARFAVAACPTAMAFSGSRLYFATGCSTWSGAVASIDPAAPGEPVTVLTGIYIVTALAGTADHLVVATDDYPGPITSYATAADGTITKIATLSADSNIGSIRNLAVNSGGTRLVVAGNSPYDRVLGLALPSLSTVATYVGDFASAGAISPDGSRVLIGSDSNNASNLRMYTAGGQMLWQRAGVARSYHDGMFFGADRTGLRAAVAFSSDGTMAYALRRDSTGAVHLYRSTTDATTATVSISVKAVYKRATMVTVHVPGGTGTVDLDLYDGNTTRSLGSATLVNGIARKSLPASTLGHVRAVYLGDIAHAATISERVTVTPASRLGITMLGQHKVARGVHKYASSDDVRVRVRLEPRQGAKPLYIQLWKLKKGKWKSTGVTKMKTDNTGKLVIIFSKRVAGKLSFTAWYAGDHEHGETGVAGPTFTIAS